MLKEKDIVTVLDLNFEIRKVVCGTAIGFATDKEGHILTARFDTQTSRLLNTVSRVDSVTEIVKKLRELEEEQE